MTSKSTLTARDADAWERSRRAAGIRATSLHTQRHYVDRFVRHMAGRPVVIDLVDGYMSHPSWSPSTRRSAAVAVRSLLRWAVRAGYDVPAPDLIDVPTKVRGVPRPCPQDPIRRAVMASDQETRLAVLLAACCGLRRGEIAGLRWADVDCVGGVLYVTGKGGHARRVPYTHRALVAALEVQQHATGDGTWVFPSYRRAGRPVTADHIGVIVARALSRSGAHYTCHQLRHRFATDTHAATGDLLTTQELLGHASPATTQIYVQVPDDRLRDAVTGVGDYL